MNPFDCHCLQDEHVKHELVMDVDGTINVDADPLSDKLLKIEEMNKEATSLLNRHGLDGDILKISAPRVDKSKAAIGVTAPKSRARQDLLAKAATAGSRFYATGGEMLNSDDFFIAEERKQRDIEVKKLEIKKEKFEEQLKQESKSKTVINKLRSVKEQYAYSEEGSKSLDVASLKVLYK